MESSATPLADYSSVCAWMGSEAADPIRARLRRRELIVLADFCAHVQIDPDTLIAKAAANRDIKNEYMRRLKEWVVTYAAEGRPRHEAENAVRSFFIANGLRVLAKPFRDVYSRSQPTGQ